MPKTVDHELRRSQLAAALVRLAARDGLHAVTMRAVAAEAGVSLRLVQYYFETKAELVQAGLRQLQHQSSQRWAARVENLPSPRSGRAVVEAFLAEALPTGEASRTFHLVGASYAALAMTDPGLTGKPVVAGLNHLEVELAGALRAAQADGELRPGVDPAREAGRLIALNHGIGTAVLVGQRTVAEAREILRYHVDQLFAPRRPHH
ncbi:TetR/AcrR family transcriptional regulator [Amycolatopsis acidicola]|uniref:TetR/AcrR family transcriptional regulator n=1 Tax=Amycolatopsis acidicola TaxID=2596893 RepID=A0A5N0VM86_9PSEU|nr:TetR/AcrR family transcriptional regulator [Amycolatopsis acidicola]KAA9166290.1 TetR/AcrR family transcriptional regulator [Amycolatopsis acidicola]